MQKDEKWINFWRIYKGLQILGKIMKGKYNIWKKEILEFYKQTSQFTDMGYYKDFAKNLPDDIEQLCILQRMQIIHPVAFRDKQIRNKKDCFWGDMTKVQITRLEYMKMTFSQQHKV